jgi:hypothetical protein
MNLDIKKLKMEWNETIKLQKMNKAKKLVDNEMNNTIDLQSMLHLWFFHLADDDEYIYICISSLNFFPKMPMMKHHHLYRLRVR